MRLRAMNEKCCICRDEEDLVFDDDGELICCDCLFERETESSLD